VHKTELAHLSPIKKEITTIEKKTDIDIERAKWAMYNAHKGCTTRRKHAKAHHL